MPGVAITPVQTLKTARGWLSARGWLRINFDSVLTSDSRLGGARWGRRSIGSSMQLSPSRDLSFIVRDCRAWQGMRCLVGARN